MEDRPLTERDNWCCRRDCPYIGHPVQPDGESSCVKCKREYIRQQNEENEKLKAWKARIGK